MDAAAKPLLNALSFDVEDYFQVAAFDSTIDRETWDAQPSRVDANTRALLDLLAEAGVTATFYVLGWIAERHPDLVRAIAAAGHEVACHGYSHSIVYRQQPEDFREETLRAKGILEDLVQQPVTSYRAASYSVTPKSLWALDVLYETGFRVDSSIFPIRHDRYGLIGGPTEPHVLELPCGGRLTEFPISTYRLWGVTLPVSGGGYFRLYPYAVTRALGNRVNAAGRPFVFYLHPWEIDPEQPRVSVGPFTRFRHYNNLSRCRERLRRLLVDFRFTSVGECLAANYAEGSLTSHRYSR